MALISTLASGLGTTALSAVLTLAPANAAALTTARPATAVSYQSSHADGNLYSELEPAIVHLQMEWTASVGFETEEGIQWSDPITVLSRCTGFFVDGAGHVVTAGHCVQNDEDIEVAIITEYVDQLLDGGYLPAEEYDQVLDYLLSEGLLAGTEGGAVNLLVWAYQPQGLPGRVLQKDYQAQVVSAELPENGDLALLLVGVSPETFLAIAETDPRPGTAVTAIGFPQSVESTTDTDLVRASFKSGTISSQQTMDNGLSVTEINADVDFGMSGGPTIDGDGTVVGVNSFTTGTATDAFNFITDATDLGDWLKVQGVDVTYASDADVEEASDAEVEEEKPATPAETTGGTVVKDNPPAEVGDALLGVILLVGFAVGAGSLLAGSVILVVYLVRRRAARRALAEEGWPAPTVPAEQVCSSGHMTTPGASFCYACGERLATGPLKPRFG
ncbi:serine protease [Naasia sp. SYSU D00057]|uniref:S1 family peptidase n=1 Tax=Naasia sp. SYSU D00057 TaxID=2817380 RepID=UPI001B316899|nr:serine protease [Naasia sp. SYSU D00057]